MALLLGCPRVLILMLLTIWWLLSHAHPPPCHRGTGPVLPEQISRSPSLALTAALGVCTARLAPGFSPGTRLPLLEPGDPSLPCDAFRQSFVRT